MAEWQVGKQLASVGFFTFESTVPGVPRSSSLTHYYFISKIRELLFWVFHKYLLASSSRQSMCTSKILHVARAVTSIYNNIKIKP